MMTYYANAALVEELRRRIDAIPLDDVDNGISAREAVVLFLHDTVQVIPEPGAEGEAEAALERIRNLHPEIEDYPEFATVRAALRQHEPTDYERFRDASPENAALLLAAEKQLGHCCDLHEPEKVRAAWVAHKKMTWQLLSWTVQTRNYSEAEIYDWRDAIAAVLPPEPKE